MMFKYQINLEKLKEFIVVFLLGISLFFFFIDSGGILGLRNIGIFIIFCFFCFSFFVIKRNYDFFYIIYILSFFCFIYCFFVAYANNIEFDKILNKIIVFFLLPVFTIALSIFDSRSIKKSLIYSGNFFSTTILISFLFFLRDPVSAELFFKQLEIPGWFYLRSDNFPQVYFQATLTLVPISIFAYLNGFKKSAIFMILTLLLSLSRFGFFSSIFILFLAKFFKIKNRLEFFNFIFITIVFIFPIFGYFIYTNADLTRIQSAFFNEDGLYIRIGHLYSVYSNFDTLNFVFGSGSGSFFYTIGFHEYVDNIEISQLESLRRNGVVGYTLISILLILISSYFVKKNMEIEFFSFLSFYLVAFSNPVLLTVSLSILSACLLNQCSSYKKGKL